MRGAGAESACKGGGGGGRFSRYAALAWEEWQERSRLLLTGKAQSRPSRNCASLAAFTAGRCELQDQIALDDSARSACATDATSLPSGRRGLDSPMQYVGERVIAAASTAIVPRPRRLPRPLPATAAVHHRVILISSESATSPIHWCERRSEARLGAVDDSAAGQDRAFECLASTVLAVDVTPDRVLGSLHNAAVLPGA